MTPRRVGSLCLSRSLPLTHTPSLHPLDRSFLPLPPPLSPSLYIYICRSSSFACICAVVYGVPLVSLSISVSSAFNMRKTCVTSLYFPKAVACYISCYISDNG